MERGVEPWADTLSNRRVKDCGDKCVKMTDRYPWPCGHLVEIVVCVVDAAQRVRTVHRQQI